MRILLVDEQPLFREALGKHLEAMYPEATVFETNTIKEAQGVLAMYAHFELIIMDVSLAQTCGAEWLMVLHQASPKSKIIVMSCLDNTAMAKELLQQGASGYITKSAAVGDVRNAIHLVLAGEIYISPSLLSEKLSPMSEQKIRLSTVNQTQLLTQRQQEVISLLAEGLPNKMIAARLNCSDGTVKLHVSAILRALGVRNRTEAVQAALHLGLI